jgi:hypothetical protein
MGSGDRAPEFRIAIRLEKNDPSVRLHRSESQNFAVERRDTAGWEVGHADDEAAEQRRFLIPLSDGGR